MLTKYHNILQNTAQNLPENPSEYKLQIHPKAIEISKKLETPPAQPRRSEWLNLPPETEPAPTLRHSNCIQQQTIVNTAGVDYDQSIEFEMAASLTIIKDPASVNEARLLSD